MVKIVYIQILILICFSCHKKSNLPVLSYKITNEGKVAYKIDSFQFTNQDSLSFTPKNTLGKVHTFNFFFTSCPSICPPMKLKHLELVEYFKNEDDFYQYSISIDLKRDDITQLKHYAETSEVDSNKWMLLKANNDDDLQKMAKYLKTNFKPNDNGTDFYHSSYVALIDKEQYIRGFYNLLSESEFELLKKDIELLLQE